MNLGELQANSNKLELRNKKAVKPYTFITILLDLQVSCKYSVCIKRLFKL